MFLHFDIGNGPRLNVLMYLQQRQTNPTKPTPEAIMSTRDNHNPDDHDALETLFEGADGSGDYALPEEDDDEDRIDASDLVIRPDTPETFRVYRAATDTRDETPVGYISEAETYVGPGWNYRPAGEGHGKSWSHPHFNHLVQAAVDDVNGEYGPTAPAEPASA